MALSNINGWNGGEVSEQAVACCSGYWIPPQRPAESSEESNDDNQTN